MELIILFVVMVVVSVVVYFQLKGSKPEALTVSDLTVPYNQKVAKKKANMPEKKVVTEQWDKAEKVVKRDASPGDVKRRKNKPFDPVKEGLKVVAAGQVKVEEGPVALTEKEEKAQKKRLQADGFVVVKEKVKTAPKVDEQVVEEVEVEEEVDLSPAAIRLAQLKAIIAGNSAPTQGYQGNKPRGASPNQGYQGVKTADKKESLSRDDIEKKIAKSKPEKPSTDYGGKIIAHDAAKKPSKLAPWAKAPIPVEKPKEAVKAEDVAEPEPEAPKEEEWKEEEEGAGGAAEW